MQLLFVVLFTSVAALSPPSTRVIEQQRRHAYGSTDALKTSLFRCAFPTKDQSSTSSNDSNPNGPPSSLQSLPVAAPFMDDLSPSELISREPEAYKHMCRRFPPVQAKFHLIFEPSQSIHPPTIKSTSSAPPRFCISSAVNDVGDSVAPRSELQPKIPVHFDRLFQPDSTSALNLPHCQHSLSNFSFQRSPWSLSLDRIGVPVVCYESTRQSISISKQDSSFHPEILFCQARSIHAPFVFQSRFVTNFRPDITLRPNPYGGILFICLPIYFDRCIDFQDSFSDFVVPRSQLQVLSNEPEANKLVSSISDPYQYMISLQNLPVAACSRQAIMLFKDFNLRCVISFQDGRQAPSPCSVFSTSLQDLFEFASRIMSFVAEAMFRSSFHLLLRSGVLSFGSKSDQHLSSNHQMHQSLSVNGILAFCVLYCIRNSHQLWITP
jgi:hypothetical protein